MEKETIERLRAHLRKLREAMGISQEEFAHRASIDYKFYQSVEAGRRKELRVSTIERIAKVYGLEAYQLLSPEVPAFEVKQKASSTSVKLGKRVRKSKTD